MKAKVCLGIMIAILFITGCGGGMRISPVPTPNHAGSRFVYIVDSIQNSVSGYSIDATSGALTSVGAAVPADNAPIYAAATPDGNFLYVANADLSSKGVSGYRIDPMTGVLTPTSPVTFPITGDSQPLGIIVDPTSTHVYTANSASISAFAIDPASGTLTDVPGTPIYSAVANSQFQNIAITPNGQFLYATDAGNNFVWAHAINSTGLPVRLPTPVHTGAFPEGIVVDPTGRFVYVANWQTDDLSMYAIAPGTGVLQPVAGTIFVAKGCGPQELAIDPAGKSLFASCSGLSTIARFSIDPNTGELIPSPPAFSTGLATAPRGLAVDASGLFLYSAWNSQNKAGVTAIGMNGMLSPGAPATATGRGPLGVVVSGHQ